MLPKLHSLHLLYPMTMGVRRSTSGNTPVLILQSYRRPQEKPLHARTWPQMTWVDLDYTLMYISLFFSVLIQVGTNNKSFKKEKYVR